MNTFLKKIPMTIVGVMLSFAVLGNLVQSYGEIYRNILGIISAVIFIITTIKFLSDWKELKNDLNSPIGGSVFLTYPMGIMILATYIKPYNNNIAFGVWIAGIILHLVFLLRFTFKFVGSFKIKQVFPSFYILYYFIICCWKACICCKRNTGTSVANLNYICSTGFLMFSRLFK